MAIKKKAKKQVKLTDKKLEDPKVVLKMFKQAAKDGTLGRGTLAKRHVAKLEDSGYAVGKSISKTELLFPGEIKALFTFDQLMALRDRSVLSMRETRIYLGIEKEVNSDSNYQGDEPQAAVDKSEGVKENSGVSHKDSGINIISISTSNEAYTDTAVELEEDTSDTPAE